MVHWSDISDILKWYIGKIPPRISQSTPAAFPCKLIQLSVPHSTFVYYFCEISTPRQQHWKLKTVQNFHSRTKTSAEISILARPSMSNFLVLMQTVKWQNCQNVIVFAITICNQYLQSGHTWRICRSQQSCYVCTEGFDKA